MPDQVIPLFDVQDRVLVGHSKEPGVVKVVWRVAQEPYRYTVELDTGIVISDVGPLSLTAELVA